MLCHGLNQVERSLRGIGCWAPVNQKSSNELSVLGDFSSEKDSFTAG